MKTAISVPEDVFDQASQRARDLGMSRSEFFTRAARHYLHTLDAQSMTHQIDSALAELDAADESAADAVAAGRHVLAGIDDAW